MVFVSVGQDYRGDVVAILFEKIEVGNANVNTVGGLFGKSHARVQDEHLIPVSHSHAIHPKLADAAERNDLQDITHFWSVLNSPGRGLHRTVSCSNLWG